MQGLDPDVVIDDDGGFGDDILNYDTGAALSYEDYLENNAPAPVSQTVDDIGSYRDYEEVEDAEFLRADDEWLAKTRQVRLKVLIQNVSLEQIQTFQSGGAHSTA